MQTNPEQPNGIVQLDQFIEEAYQIVHAGKSDWWIVEELSDQLSQLVGEWGWLPEKYCTPQPGCSYSQYPLYIDPKEEFCVTAIAFSPLLVTPIHNHTVWGVIGIYQGEEIERRYRRYPHLDDSGEAYLLETGLMHCTPGLVSGFTAPDNDIHAIETPASGSVSIHIYGANIAKIPRLNFDRLTGKPSVVYSSFAEAKETKTEIKKVG